jgi:hypothetical protein
MGPREHIDDAEQREIIQSAKDAADQLLFWSTIVSDLTGQLLQETQAARNEGDPSK